MMLTEKEFAYWDTGWACWVAWAPEDVLPKETMAEFWGAGRGIGIYPVRGAQGVVLVGPKAIMEKAGRVQFAEQVREQFGKMTGPIAAVVRAVSQNSDAFFWDLHDCRCSVCSRGRVALLGDAAVGFLPTAGVGASMAMLSAAALASVRRSSRRSKITQAGENDVDRIDAARLGAGPVDAILYTGSCTKGNRRDHGRVALGGHSEPV
jgi:2-polyprenyl-6-methoxyphenol hydroxylase-like FAD-dependent oxidoreductase